MLWRELLFWQVLQAGSRKRERGSNIGILVMVAFAT